MYKVIAMRNGKVLETIVRTEKEAGDLVARLMMVDINITAKIEKVEGV